MDDNTVATIIGAVLAVLAIVSVGSRFYTRYYKHAGFKWDDWFILLSLSAIITADAITLYATSIDPNGAEAASSSTYVDYTSTDVLFTQLNFVGTVLYFAITCTTKLSILLMYNRLFSISRTFRYQVVALVVIVACFWIGCTVADLLNCIPLEWTWLDNMDDPRYCFNYNNFWLATGIVEALIDVSILILPVRVVSKLQLSGSKKVALTGEFLLGAFVIISGIIKVTLSYVPGSREPSFGRTLVWTTVHCCIGIICACLPVCWPLFVRCGKLLSKSWPNTQLLRMPWYRLGSQSPVEKTDQQKASSVPAKKKSSNILTMSYELPI